MPIEGLSQFIIVQPLQRGPDARTQVEAAVLGMNLEAGVEGWREGPAANVILVAGCHAIGFQIVIHCGHADGQIQAERLADGDLERRADVHAERRGLRRLPVVRTVLAERQPQRRCPLERHVGMDVSPCALLRPAHPEEFVAQLKR